MLKISDNKENDKDITALLTDYENYIYSGLLSIINIFDPKLILIYNRILGIYPSLIRNLKKRVYKYNKIEIDIELSELKEDSCCLGACISNVLDFLNINFLKLKK